jgi:hypothetical protein
MLYFVLMCFIVEELNLCDLLIALLYKNAASLDHLLALGEDLFNLVEVVLLDYLQERFEASSDILNPLYLIWILLIPTLVART